MHNHPPHLLLAEDSWDEAELNLRTIERYDPTLEVQVVSDGQEALQLLTSYQTSPRLIVLGLQLPKLSGLEVLEQLRQLDTCRYTPVVIATADTNPANLVRAYQYGANSFIVKPHAAEQTQEYFTKLLHYWLRLNQTP